MGGDTGNEYGLKDEPWKSRLDGVLVGIMLCLGMYGYTSGGAVELTSAPDEELSTGRPATPAGPDSPYSVAAPTPSGGRFNDDVHIPLASAS